MNPFLLSEEEIGPFKLRPWSVFTQLAVSQLDSSKLSEVEQMLAFVWLQSKDPKEVRKLLTNGKAISEIKDFCDCFPLALIKPISDWVTRQNALILENQIEVIPRPDSEDKDAPKN